MWPILLLTAALHLHQKRKDKGKERVGLPPFETGELFAVNEPPYTMSLAEQVEAERNLDQTKKDLGDLRLLLGKRKNLQAGVPVTDPSLDRSISSLETLLAQRWAEVEDEMKKRIKLSAYHRQPVEEVVPPSLWEEYVLLSYLIVEGAVKNTTIRGVRWY